LYELIHFLKNPLVVTASNFNKFTFVVPNLIVVDDVPNIKQFI